ncbi:putative Aldose 1-epimerase [Tenacibaculum sp. 190130A14a]|uniref:Aldose 1-epimerase n=1 Tax=Tenacibaculum polynesiense TaxID=3137857 RepID=A0ABP1EUA4_9FLAO
MQKGNSKAVISLKNGGSISHLTLNNKIIIKDFSDKVDYHLSYASAILFPFANRILNGEYEFQNKKHQLKQNTHGNNAIHGLLFNKTFEVLESTQNTNYVATTLSYTQTIKENGFPFLFTVNLTYVLFENELSLKVTITNIDANPFPFTIGWHPYFYANNRGTSILKLNTEKEIIHNNKMIPVKMEDSKLPKSFQVSNQQLDNCYLLKDDYVIYKTEDYTMKLSSSFDKNFIQIYTPEIDNHIAIEPITGPSNSFNNNVGLKILSPKDTFNIQWTIQLQDE